ncbi:hypothetical protein [Prosthecobacter fluviatilis]|uniref:Lipoprotein n=1 Tax=Prosthecobacter fluviatilis TaxID=445931 RepID=A0ABW0KX11_9BACT
MTLMLRVLTAVLLACLLTSCPETTVDEDFGLRPVALDVADWNGAWTTVNEKEEDAVQFAVTDSVQGRILMTEPGNKEDKPVELAIRRASADSKVKLCFAVAKERDVKKAGPVSLFLMRVAEGGVLYTWSIDHEAVAAAIKAGHLKGVVKADKNGAHSHLDSAPQNYAKLLEPQFWNWSEPTCLTRTQK